MATRKTFPLARTTPTTRPSDNATKGQPTVPPQALQISPPPAPGQSLAKRALAARATIGGPAWNPPQSQQQQTHHGTSISSVPLVRRAPAQPFSSPNARQAQQMQSSSAMHSTVHSPISGASMSSSATAPVHRPSSVLVQSPRNRSLGMSNTEIHSMQMGLASPRSQVAVSTTPRSQLGTCTPRAAASSPALSPRQSQGYQSGQLAIKTRTLTPPYSQSYSSSSTGAMIPSHRLRQQGTPRLTASGDEIFKHARASVDNKIDSSDDPRTFPTSIRLQAKFPPEETRSKSQALAETLALRSKVASNSPVGQTVESPGVAHSSASLSENQHAGSCETLQEDRSHRPESYATPNGAMPSSSDIDALGISGVGPFVDMDSRLLHLFTSSSYQHIAEKGDVFFAEGESDDRMFIMVQGEVEMMTSVLPGHKPFTRILRAPCYFGEACALGLRHLRGATVRALTVCEVRILLGETVRELLHRFPHEEKLILNEAKSRLAGLAIWEGVSRKRNEENQFRPTSGSTTSWSQESSVAVSRRGSFSNRSGFHKTSSLGSQASSMPSAGSQASSVPISRTGSKSPPLKAQDGTGQGSNGKQSSDSTGPSTSTDPKSSGSGSSPGLEAQQNVAPKSVVESSSSSGWQNTAEGDDRQQTCEEMGSEVNIKPWMVALAEVTSPRDALYQKNKKIASEVPCEFAWSDGSVQNEMMEIAQPLPSARNRGRSREDCESSVTRLGVSREDSVSSRSSPGFEPASSMSRLPGTSSLRVLPAVGNHSKGAALDAHPEDRFEDELGPKYSPSDGTSSALSSCRSSPQALTPVNGQSSSRKWQQRNRGHRKHRPPKPRAGWQESLCHQVIINYPSSLPSKDTFVKRKVPRPVSREASCGSIGIEGLQVAVESLSTEANTVVQAGLPEAAANRLRESSPEIEFADAETM